MKSTQPSQSGSLFPTSSRYVKNPQKNWKTLLERRETAVMSVKQTKRAKGTVGEGAAGKKAKTTQHAGGQSVSEKCQATRK